MVYQRVELDLFDELKRKPDLLDLETKYDFGLFAERCHIPVGN